MKLENATPAVAHYVRQVIAYQMAETLHESGADLGDDTAVVTILSKGNFGSQSIAMLMNDAVNLAKCSCSLVISGVVAFGLMFAAIDDRREFGGSGYGYYNRQTFVTDNSNLRLANPVTGQ